jgi:hypothetical protein
MARTQRAIIDDSTFVFEYEPDFSLPVQEDYIISGNLTIWGVGLITFGPPTQVQKDWIADPYRLSRLTGFRLASRTDLLLS